MTRIRIYLADDHTVLRAGLRTLLNAETDMQVVGETGGTANCVTHIVESMPDVLLLDINMPCCNGLDVLAALRMRAPAIRVLVLTMHDDAEYLRQVLSTGGAGYVLKEAAETELLAAIRTVYTGGVFLHPEHARILTEKPIAQEASLSASETPLTSLSERELEVLRLIALGHSNREIAGQINVSVKTVETYKARGMDKLGLVSRAALVRFALDHDLLDALSGKS